MPELSHETPEEGFHEIQLSGKQLVFLFIVTTMVSVTIFLFGVYVGRGAGAAVRQEIGADAQPAAEPVPGATQAQPPARPAEPPDAEGGEDLSYNERLRGAPSAEAAGSAAATARPAPPSTPPIDVPTSGQPGTLVVQVVALQDQAAAAGVVKRLIAKGYPAFVVPPASKQVPQLYKVQVGRYTERREAEQVMRRIAKEERFSPWISR